MSDATARSLELNTARVVALQEASLGTACLYFFAEVSQEEEKHHALQARRADDNQRALDEYFARPTSQAGVMNVRFIRNTDDQT